jgi:hypothetical protein
MASSHRDAEVRREKFRGARHLGLLYRQFATGKSPTVSGPSKLQGSHRPTLTTYKGGEHRSYTAPYQN